MQDIIEILFDNFFIVLYVAIGCIIFTLAFTTYLIRHNIGTKVIVCRKTTAEIHDVKEKIGEGTVRLGKLMIPVTADPLFCKVGLLRTFRLYRYEEGAKSVTSLLTPIKDKEVQTDSENVMFSKLLESEVVTQAVRGLVGTRLEKLIYMGAGGFLAIILWEIIRAWTSGGS